MRKEIDFLKEIVLKANDISKNAFEICNKGAENDLVTTVSYTHLTLPTNSLV